MIKFISKDTKILFILYRDANLWRSKIRRFFFYNTPASNYPPPKKKAMTPPPHQNDLHTLKSTQSFQCSP